MPDQDVYLVGGTIGECGSVDWLPCEGLVPCPGKQETARGGRFHDQSPFVRPGPSDTGQPASNVPIVVW